MLTSFLSVVLFSAACVYGCSVSNQDGDKEPTDRPAKPISAHMSCYQEAEDVLCGFKFANVAEEDYYLLKRQTPLEGLYHPFLTVKHGNRRIMYEGIMARRLPVTKSEYVLLQAGSTIYSPMLKLTEAYKFAHDGLYTIEYTRPLQYLSRNKMAMLQDNELVQNHEVYAGESVLASAQVLVIDAYKLRMLEKEEENRRSFFEEESNEAPVEIMAKCKSPSFVGGTKEQQAQTQSIHEGLCNRYPTVINAILGKPASFRLWFGTGSTSTVNTVCTASLNGLSKDALSYNFFGGIHCAPNPNWIAYTYDDCRTVYLCQPYVALPSYCKKDVGFTKESTLVHEWTHAYSHTNDYAGGIAACQQLAIDNPAHAIDNADSYAQFYCFA